jgi:hypothetical protein
MVPGSSFTVKAGEAGTAIAYHCTIHTRVRGQVIADLPPDRNRLPVTTPQRMYPVFPPAPESSR